MITINNSADYKFVEDKTVKVIELSQTIDKEYPSLEECTVGAGKKLMELCHTELLLRSKDLFIAVRSPGFAKINVIQRRSKVFKSEQFSWLPENAVYYESNLLVNKSGQYFFGLAKIRENFFVNALNCCRRSDMMFLFFTERKLEEENILKYIPLFTEEKGCVCWKSIIRNLCPSGDIPVKVDGCYDDREVAISVFFKDVSGG